MSSPYVQVSLTYVRRWGPIRNYVTLFFAIVIAVLISCARAAGEKDPRWLLHPGFLFLAAYFFIGLASHIRQQFADSRSRLMPGFARPHVIVAVAVILVAAVLLPAALTWRSTSDH